MKWEHLTVMNLGALERVKVTYLQKVLQTQDLPRRAGRKRLWKRPCWLKICGPSDFYLPLLNPDNYLRREQQRGGIFGANCTTPKQWWDENGHIRSASWDTWSRLCQFTDFIMTRKTNKFHESDVQCVCELCAKLRYRCYILVCKNRRSLISYSEEDWMHDCGVYLYYYYYYYYPLSVT
jgi:hypothetical protein